MEEEEAARGLQTALQSKEQQQNTEHRSNKQKIHTMIYMHSIKVGTNAVCVGCSLAQ